MPLYLSHSFSLSNTLSLDHFIYLFICLLQGPKSNRLQEPNPPKLPNYKWQLVCLHAPRQILHRLAWNVTAAWRRLTWGKQVFFRGSGVTTSEKQLKRTKCLFPTNSNWAGGPTWRPATTRPDGVDSVCGGQNKNHRHFSWDFHNKVMGRTLCSNAMFTLQRSVLIF